jgi:hypothetical protein
MGSVAIRIGIALMAFVIAWVAASLMAQWLFGSGNILVWVIAAIVGVGVYLVLARRDGALRNVQER